MTCLLKLRDYVDAGHRVTVVSESEYHYYSGMGPGMLSGMYRPREARFHVARMARERGAKFVDDSVVGIDAGERRLHLQGGGDLCYDVVSFNTGSTVPVSRLAPAGQSDVFPVKPITRLLDAQRLILEAVEGKGTVRLVVVGAGPAGVEIAGNLWRLVTDAGGRANIVLLAGGGLLHRFPPRARRLAADSLEGRGIHVLEGVAAERLAGGVAALEDGREIPYDAALVATGIEPSAIFQESELPTGPDGGLLVNAHLQCVEWPEVFGGGDCIDLQGTELARVGVHAVRQNPVLHHNLMVALETGTFRRFEPDSDYLLILNLGDGRGVAVKWGHALDGRLAFRLKDYIDRRFMRRFQVSGELQEQPDPPP
jgi:NADH dehydrogenase FAD-containing subunit